MPTGKLTHVAGTFDGSALRLYIDGTEDSAVVVEPGGVPDPPHPLRIGGDSNHASRFAGLVDELAIYSRALAPAEIKAIFNAGANGRCKP